MNENINTGDMAIAAPAVSMTAAPRTLEVVAAEIRTFTASMLNNIIEIGRRMCEAKEMLPYGQFGKWIEENTDYSKSTANNFMRLYLELGTMQGSLFGATVEDVQTFGKLSYSKALALLALPSGEREEFVGTHDVESMSTRDLQEAIRERDKAREALEREQESRRDAEKTAGELRRKIRELEEAPPAEVLHTDQGAIDKAVAEAVGKANAAHAAELEKLRAGEEKKRKELEKKVTRAENAAKAAEEKAEEAGKGAAGEADTLREEAGRLKDEAERLRKQLAMSGEVTVTFKLYFAAWQKDYANMMDALAQADEETAGRFRAAIKAQIEGWSNG